jgi:hypothetical protein
VGLKSVHRTQVLHFAVWQPQLRSKACAAQRLQLMTIPAAKARILLLQLLLLRAPIFAFSALIAPPGAANHAVVWRIKLCQFPGLRLISFTIILYFVPGQAHSHNSLTYKQRVGFCLRLLTTPAV